jgi:hypothetical protein
MTVANILEGAPSDHISVHVQVDMVAGAFRAAMMNVSESSAAETDDQRLRSEPETDASLEECRGLALGMWP